MNLLLWLLVLITGLRAASLVAFEESKEGVDCSEEDLQNARELLSGLRDEEKRAELMEDIWSRRKSYNRLALVEVAESEEDIKLLEEYLLDPYLTVSLAHEISTKRLIPGMKRILRKAAFLAFAAFPVDLLNEFIDEINASNDGCLSYYMRYMVDTQSWGKIQDLLRGVQPKKMAQLQQFDVVWSKEELEHRQFPNFKVRMIFLMNVYKFPLRILGEDGNTKVLEITNGGSINGATNLRLTCWQCQETILSDLHGMPQRVEAQELQGCCLPRWAWFSGEPKQRFRMEYVHTCPNCQTILLHASDQLPVN